MVSVRTSILGRPRPLPRDRHADTSYTLIWEEPEKVVEHEVTPVVEAQDLTLP
jgi:hypothetical protein